MKVEDNIKMIVLYLNSRDGINVNSIVNVKIDITENTSDKSVYTCFSHD